MTRKKYVIGNWKMNMTAPEAEKFFERLDKEVDNYPDVEVAIAPPSLSIYPLSQKIDTSKFKLAAQNVHFEDSGTFAGEISGRMLKGLVKYGLVGHSDRRQKFHEHDHEIARKLAAALRNGIVPVLCVGEDLMQKQNGDSNLIVHDQVANALAMLTDDDVSQVIIAYEPVWAISSGDGKGLSADPDTVKPVIDVIRKTVRDLYGEKAEQNLHVLYGGSTNPDNIAGYMNIEGVDGVLSGGASMNYKQFAGMIEKAHNL